MATVFMKWLEKTPGDYDRGIWLLTLGRLGRLKRHIATRRVQPGDRVLEIGCGTGGLALLMARRGAHVVAVDVDEGMLFVARRQAAQARLADWIEFRHLNAADLEGAFEPGSFDLVVSTLAFSEFSSRLRHRVLAQVGGLLRQPGGRLLLADEVVPVRLWVRLPFYAVRLPLALVTWLLTRTTTRALGDPAGLLASSGFRGQLVASYLGGSLQLWEAIPQLGRVGTAEFSVPRLCHQTSFQTRLRDLYCLLNRLVPPYPRFPTGLYQVGRPDCQSPILVTGNYDLTVRRLLQAIDGQVDSWLLVADSRGINVWCAAGGGHFGADDVVAAVKAHPLDQVVDHRSLILPQLCANGVDGWQVRRETGWRVHWGPIRACDIPAYLEASCTKSDAMRRVDFPLADRLEMTAGTLAFYALLLSPALWLFQRRRWRRGLALMSTLSLVYGVGLPWIPGRDGLEKGAALATGTVGLTAIEARRASWSRAELWNRSLGYSFLAFFVGAEYQGMSPSMRGEQANWGVEALVAAGALLLHRLGALLLGRGGA